MIAVAGTLLGLLLAALALAWYAFDRQRQVYEHLFAVLERDRDEARQEAKVFRRLVLPVFDKAEQSVVSAAPASPPQQETAGATEGRAGANHSSPAALHPLLNRRTPFRLRFKSAARMLNTKQKKIDALAASLGEQNPGANPHAETR